MNEEELTEYWIISQQFLNKFLEIYDCLVEDAGKHVKFNYYKIREHNLKKMCIAHFMKDDNREMIRRVIEERLPPKLIYHGPPRSGATLRAGSFAPKLPRRCKLFVYN